MPAAADSPTVAFTGIAPLWLDRERTLARVIDRARHDIGPSGHHSRPDVSRLIDRRAQRRVEEV